jgi:uncharacterized tellurite resistance protein B-like protein
VIKSIKTFFERNIRTDAQTSGVALEHRLQLATAALLLEMARVDQAIAHEELQRVSNLLQRRFSIDRSECNKLLDLAEQELRESVDYYEFTSLIHQHFDYPQKLRIIEHLWEIAFADGNLDMYEEHFVRKLADLLFVRHSDFILAKLRVLDALDGQSEPS